MLHCSSNGGTGSISLNKIFCVKNSLVDPLHSLSFRVFIRAELFKSMQKSFGENSLVFRRILSRFVDIMGEGASPSGIVQLLPTVPDLAITMSPAFSLLDD